MPQQDSLHDSACARAPEVTSGGRRYRKQPFSQPRVGALYSVRDKAKGERIVEVVKIDGDEIEVVILDDGKRSTHRIGLELAALERQAAKGWCNTLVPVDGNADEEQPAPDADASADNSEAQDSESAANLLMRLDIQNFSRCCADIARAGIRFDTQLIKDIADGPFRAGNYEQAFITFEQIAVGFVSAVGASRRTIADGRRALTAQKGKLSGKEIEERKAAFVRSEQLIGAAERSFSTILEGLRMYLRGKHSGDES